MQILATSKPFAYAWSMTITARKTDCRIGCLARLWLIRTSVIIALGMTTLMPAGAQKTELVIAASAESDNPSFTLFNPANIAAFEKSRPDIAIRKVFIPDTQSRTTFQAMIATGEGADIICYSKISAENDLDAPHTMIDLSNEPWARRLTQPEVLRSPDGKIYLFQRAIDIYGIGLVYDEALFQPLKLKPPRTYQELLSVCAVLKTRGIVPIWGPFKDNWTFQIWPTAAWGTVAARLHPSLWTDINAGRQRWSEVAEFRDTLERVLELQKRGFFQERCLADGYDSAEAAFRDGKCGMMMAGQWFIVDMYQKEPRLRLGLVPLPVFDAPKLNLLSQGQYGGAFIPRQAKHIAAAKAFFDFLSQPAQIARDLAAPASSYQPNFTDVPGPDKPWPIARTLYLDWVKPGMVSTEMNAYMKVDMSDSWRLYQDMLAGIRSPREVLAAWDLRFRQLMKDKGQPGF